MRREMRMKRRRRRATAKWAALTLACAAAMNPPAARAQGGPADQPPVPELAYDTYFEPFTDNPLFRVHQPEPFAPIEPLFKKFDPLDGLTREAKVSRVVASGRGIAALPVLTATTGGTLAVPFYLQTATPVPAYVLRFNYDPTVLRATGVEKANWIDSSLNFNVHPDQTTPERRVFIVQYSGDEWAPDGPPVRVMFDVIGTGDANLTIEDADVSDDTFNNVKMVAHDGLVRVSR